jgi:hypothetical protein
MAQTTSGRAAQHEQQHRRHGNLFVRRYGIPIAIVMLVVWAAVTVSTEAPGWIHGLLTFGVFLLLWAIVERGADKPRRR